MIGVGTEGLQGDTRTSPHSFVRCALLALLASLVMMAFAANALAASGAPVNMGTPFDIGAMSVGVDSAGTGYMAWANTKDLPPTTTDVVQYCVIPPGATSCAHSGTLTPANSASHIDNVQVLVDGSTVVILADVYGSTGGSSGHYEPEQEWQSTDGGASFNIVNGGVSVVDGTLNADSAPLGGVILPGTNELGYGWNTAGGSPPTFSAFPLSSPPECSGASTPRCPFASLEPNTNPDQISNAGGQFASQTGANPGVLGIFNTDFTNGPLGCSNAQTVPFGTAFAYGSGAQAATNDYSTSPGSPNSAWTVAIAQGDCNVEYPAVAGGPSGFGVLEVDEIHDTVVYHKFNPATNSFVGTPLVTIAQHGELYPSLSQDGAGGIYGTYLGGGNGGPITLAYSGNGGTSWASGTFNPNTDTGAGTLTSSVGPTGQGWAAWIDNGSVFAQQFVAADAISADTVSTSQTAGATTGASISVPGGTLGETDKATIIGNNASTATGTVTYGLFTKSSCAAASEIFHSTVTVAAGSAAASSPVTSALADGKYYWQAVYSGNTFNKPSSSPCGSEVLNVGQATSASGGGTSNGTTVTLTISCAVTPCTVTITITIDPPAARDAGTARKKTHPKIVTLATGTFKIRHRGKDKLAVKLTKAGKSLLAAHHGHLKASILVADHTRGGVVKRTGTINITTKH
jgi:hypothetical protein